MEFQAVQSKAALPYEFVEAYLVQRLDPSGLPHSGFYSFQARLPAFSYGKTVTLGVEIQKARVNIQFSAKLDLPLVVSSYAKTVNELNINCKYPNTKFSLTPHYCLHYQVEITQAEIQNDLRHSKEKLSLLESLEYEFLSSARRLQGQDPQMPKQPNPHKKNKKGDNILLDLQHIISSRIAQKLGHSQTAIFTINSQNINQTVDRKEASEQKNEEKQERVEKMKKEYLKFVNSYENKMTKKNNKEVKLPDRILRIIKFDDSTQSKGRTLDILGESVRKISTIYTVFLMSVNRNTNQFIQVQESECREGCLVEKQCPTQTQMRPYFMNEVGILKFMKNLNCFQIACYYVEELNLKQEPSRFYVDYYEDGMQCLRTACRPKFIFSFLIKLLEGIIFMTKNKVTHRDLKPENIRLNKSRETKIIDFGSAYCSANGFQREGLPEKLATTRHYNLKYPELDFNVQQSISREKFEKHKLFDMYAFSVIAQELTNASNLTMSMKLRVHLGWLLRSCAQQNPQKRAHPMEALCFLFTLQKIFLASTV